LKEEEFDQMIHFTRMLCT